MGGASARASGREAEEEVRHEAEVKIRQEAERPADSRTEGVPEGGPTPPPSTGLEEILRSLRQMEEGRRQAQENQNELLREILDKMDGGHGEGSLSQEDGRKRARMWNQLSPTQGPQFGGFNPWGVGLEALTVPRPPTPPRGGNCGGRHLTQECRRPYIICSRCGQSGHIAPRCPSSRTRRVGSQQVCQPTAPEGAPLQRDIEHGRTNDPERFGSDMPVEPRLHAPPRCGNCGKGHLTRNCRRRKVICYSCGQPGHIAPRCPNPGMMQGGPQHVHRPVATGGAPPQEDVGRGKTGDPGRDQEKPSGRVNFIKAKRIGEASRVVIGTLPIPNSFGFLIFDSSFTHSFLLEEVWGEK
jgi:hypothetical protein